MITAPPGVRVLVWSTPVDFRAGMDRLAALVQVTLRLDPFAGDVFIFRPKRADRVKIVVYDGTGLVLYAKRLEAGRFSWPSPAEGVVRLSAAQLATEREVASLRSARDSASTERRGVLDSMTAIVGGGRVPLWNRFARSRTSTPPPI